MHPLLLRRRRVATALALAELTMFGLLIGYVLSSGVTERAASCDEPFFLGIALRSKPERNKTSSFLLALLAVDYGTAAAAAS